MRRAARAATLALVSLVLLPACSTSEEGTYQGVCRDPDSGVRVDDDYCEADDSDYDPSYALLWYLAGQNVARVGQPLTGGYVDPPRSSRLVYGGVPASGGSVSRRTIRNGTSVARTALPPQPSPSASARPSASAKPGASASPKATPAPAPSAKPAPAPKTTPKPPPAVVPKAPPPAAPKAPPPPPPRVPPPPPPPRVR